MEEGGQQGGSSRGGRGRGREGETGGTSKRKINIQAEFNRYNKKTKTHVPLRKTETVMKLSEQLYSVHNHLDWRVFVNLATDIGEINRCTSKKCLDSRTTFLKSEMSQQFYCTHIKKVQEQFPQFKETDGQFSKDDVKNKLELHENIPADIKENVIKFMSNLETFKAVKLSNSCFAITTPPKSNSPEGMLHIYLKGKSWTCEGGSSCDRASIQVSKRRSVKTACPHEMITNIILGIYETGGDVNEDEGTDETEGSNEIYRSIDTTANWILKNKHMAFSSVAMEEIEMEIGKIKEYPIVFNPNVKTCPNCNATNISSPQRHQGVEFTFLLTKNSFNIVTALIQKCKNCLLVIQAQHPLIVNVGDSLLVTKYVIFLMRDFIFQSVPPGMAASTVLKNLCRKLPTLAEATKGKSDWIGRQLVVAFYALEALDEDKEETQICGICGIIPLIVSSDGGEDIAVDLNDEHLKVDDNATGEYTSDQLDTVIDKLKLYHLGALVYPDVQFRRPKPKINISNLPPFILPSYRGDTLYNTEFKKDSTFLDAKQVGGSQQLLLNLVEDSYLKIEELDTLSDAQLVDILKKIGLQPHEVSKLTTKTSKKRAILDLYESVLSGFSQCHHTGNRKRTSGGWYCEICPHGVTISAKFLFLAESCRDCIDLKKSKKYVEVGSNLDTPCTAAGHLVLRDREDLKEGKIKKISDGQASKWFDGRRGCFEKPESNKNPSKISVPFLELESRKNKKIELPNPRDLKPDEHPLTQSTQKYFVGDRFHNTKYPHKSPLCGFHDINLCPQLVYAKTSGQENLNNIRNRNRLQTACTQSLPTHIFYNLIMDRAANRDIVENQARDLDKNLYDRHSDYKHFV